VSRIQISGGFESLFIAGYYLWGQHNLIWGLCIWTMGLKGFVYGLWELWFE